MVATALQGRVAGVQVNQLNGQPGAGIQVRIRGSNSLKGDNEPLWIINGAHGDINMINTSDIESVEVLKDASATAIYGSRGANGVVIVTTKGARAGEVKVRYEGSVGVQSLAKGIDMLGGTEYMEYLDKKAEINSQPELFTRDEIDANVFNTNWQDEIFRSASITNHSVDVAGGTENFLGSLGASYFNQQGIVRESCYERKSLRTNLNYIISRHVSVSANIIGSRSNHNQMNSQGGSRGTSMIGAALVSSPLATPRYDDGSWNDFVTQPVSGQNPLAYLADFATKEKFMDLVLTERGYETIFEGKRYCDLKRCGKLAEYALAAGRIASLSDVGDDCNSAVCIGCIVRRHGMFQCGGEQRRIERHVHIFNVLTSSEISSISGIIV